MKRVSILCLALLLAAGLFSCNKENKGNGGNDGNRTQATFRRADLTGASSLALVSSGQAKASLTKGQGDQSFDTNVSAPLYKVSADGKMVQVKYTIEVQTKGDEEGQVLTEELQANLTLKIEYIYPLGDNWLWLYNCDYSYPVDYTTLPHGPLRNALSDLMNGNNLRQHYLVRLSDGALFKMDRSAGAIIRATGNPRERSPKEMQCVVEEIGGNLYYLNEEKKLFCLVDKGNTLAVTQVLNNTIQNEFILPAQPGALGVMPLYGQGTQYTGGQPSVVFPLPTGIVGISGLNSSDAGKAQLVSADNDLYVFRQTGNTGAELTYPVATDVSLKVGGNTVSLMKMPSPLDNSTGRYKTPEGQVIGGTLYSYACYRTEVEANTKVYVCKGDQTFGSGAYSYYQIGEGIFDYYFSTATGASGASEPVLTLEKAGAYSFYLMLAEQESAYAGYLCAIPEENQTVVEPNGYIRFDNRYSISLYKVELGNGSAALSQQPIVSFYDEMPNFNQGRDDFSSRTRRVFSGKVITWLSEDAQQGLKFGNRVDITAGTYARSILPTHFPTDIDAYYEGVAYVVSEDNQGLYKCSLATATEEKLVVDFSELETFRSKMMSDPANPVFIPGKVPAVQLTAWLVDGTYLNIYVDLEGGNALKAKVYTINAGGAGEVLSVLVRLN